MKSKAKVKEDLVLAMQNSKTIDRTSVSELHDILQLLSYAQLPWCSGIVGGFIAKGLEFKTIKTPLVFIRKGILNLKCYVAPVKSLVR